MTPEIQKLLNDAPQITGPNGGISLWIDSLRSYAFFTGYNGQTGKMAIKSYLKDLMSKLQSGPQNQYTEEMYNQAEALSDPRRIDQFCKMHTDQTTGDLIWTDTSTGYTYDWTNPGTGKINDQDMIMDMINAGSQGGGDQPWTVNPWISSLNINKMNKMYRMNTLDQILGEYKKDPVFAITLWILTVSDTTTESEITGDNKNTDLLTQATNYANQLADSVSAFTSNPNPTAEDAANFAKTLDGAYTFFNQSPQLGGLQDTFNSEVYNQISNIQVSFKEYTGPLGKLMKGMVASGDFKDLATVLSTAFYSNPPAPGPAPAPGPTPAPSPSYSPNANIQVVTNAADQLSSLVTGQSKTLSTETATKTATIKAINDAASALLSMVKMDDKVIAHYGD